MAAVGLEGSRSAGLSACAWGAESLRKGTGDADDVMVALGELAFDTL